MNRSLLYNCCALSINDEWKMNIDKLCSYSEIFNGKKIVIVREGVGIRPVEEIKSYFTLPGIEFIVFPNDADKHEAAGFLDALSGLKSCGPNDAIFYAHTKGVRYNPLTNDVSGIRDWRDKMYHECLHDLGKIDRLLSTYACVGCFKNYANSSRGYTWFYAGNFWWVKSERLFSKPWKKLPHQDLLIANFGVEAYLGTLFTDEEAYCLYNEPLSNFMRTIPKHGIFECQCGHFFKDSVNPLQKLQGKRRCPRCFERTAIFIAGC